MDSHPKKRKKKKRKTSTEQIRNQSTVISLAEKAKYSPYKAKANHTPLPNTTIQICLLKKKKKPNTEKTKPQTQSKPNPRWDADGHVAHRHSSLRRSSSLSTRRRLVARPPLVVTRREGLVADRCRSQIADRCSTAPSGGATYGSGCSQEHPDLKKIKKKKFIFNPYYEHPQSQN